MLTKKRLHQMHIINASFFQPLDVFTIRVIILAVSFHRGFPYKKVVKKRRQGLWSGNTSVQNIYLGGVWSPGTKLHGAKCSDFCSIMNCI
jgi:hypothetical protein